MNEDQSKDLVQETTLEDKKKSELLLVSEDGDKQARITSQTHQRKGRQHANKQRNNNNQKETAVSCCVCQSKEPKYKCPKCLLPYCSVNCCKEHKLEKCVFQAPVTPIIKREERSIAPSNVPVQELVVLTEAQKERLRSSSKLRALLKNTRLQRHLSLINSERAERRQQKLKEIRENNPEFEEVVSLFLEAVTA